jgi:hypothetical protein
MPAAVVSVGVNGGGLEKVGVTQYTCAICYAFGRVGLTIPAANFLAELDHAARSGTSAEMSDRMSSTVAARCSAGLWSEVDAAQSALAPHCAWEAFCIGPEIRDRAHSSRSSSP